MSTIYLDIETVPSQAPDIRAELARDIKPPGTLKKPESIAEWEAASKPGAVEEAYLKTSFDGGAGQIVCIGWAVDDGPAQSVTAPDLSAAQEAAMLAAWFATLRDISSGTHHSRPVLVGHNHVAFDLPFLWKRAVVHGHKPPLWWPRDPKPWSDTVADTMVMWAGTKDRISMDKLCRILGLPGKGGHSGADVWPMVQAGKLDDVSAYCRADVERTRAMYHRLTFDIERVE